MSNTFKIKKITAATEEEWNEIYEKCDYATYFHSVEFSRLIKAYTPQIEVATQLVEFSDGKKALFILFKEFSFKGLLAAYISSALGTYGGWISADDLLENHDKLLIKYINNLNLLVRVSPYYPGMIADKINTQSQYTMRLSLDKDYGEIHKNFEYRHKHAIKKAFEKGVSVKKAETLDEWKTYYEIYLDSIRRWGDKARSFYKWELFESFFKNESDHINLYIAVYDAKIVAGAVCFNDKRKILYWHGAYLDEFKNVNPVTCLIAEIIRDSVASYDYFDFLPSIDLEGVSFFKKGYRPDYVLSPIFINRTAKYNAMSRVLHFARKLTQISK